MKTVFSIINAINCLVLLSALTLGTLTLAQDSKTHVIGTFRSKNAGLSKEEIEHCEKLVQKIAPDLGSFRLLRYTEKELPSYIASIIKDLDGLEKKGGVPAQELLPNIFLKYLCDKVSENISALAAIGAAVNIGIIEDRNGELHNDPNDYPTLYVGKKIWKLPIEEQMAILSHEIGHFIEEHGAQHAQLTEQQNKINSIWRTILASYLKYKRACLEQKHEFQADDYTVLTGTSNGLIKYFERIKKTTFSNPIDRIGEYLSSPFHSHPSPDARIAHIKATAQADYDTLMAEVD